VVEPTETSFHDMEKLFHLVNGPKKAIIINKSTIESSFGNNSSFSSSNSSFIRHKILEFSKKNSAEIICEIPFLGFSENSQPIPEKYITKIANYIKRVEKEKNKKIEEN